MKNVVNLLALSALSVEAHQVYEVMKKQKGKNFTTDNLSEKLATVEENELKDAVSALVDSGLIVKNEDENSKFLGYVFPKMSAEELADESANNVGGKKHTTKTSNTNCVFYKGDRVVFKTHTLSPEAKNGMLVQFGQVSRTHINEQGFQYFIIKKEDSAGELAGTCAKKSNAIALVDANGKAYNNHHLAPVPENVTEMIGLKKAAADVAKPDLVTAMPLELSKMKGSAVLVFVAEGSPAARALQSLLENAKKELVSKILIVDVDAFWNARLAAQMEVREVPTLISLKDGKTLARSVGSLSEEDLKSFLDNAVKSQGKTAPLSELPYTVEAVEEAETKSTENDTETSSEESVE